MLTLERAKELLHTTTTEEHLFLHAMNVSVAMGGLAEHFGEDAQHWMAIGYLHDYDYQQHPDEHLHHTQQPLLDAGVDSVEVRAILAHGYGHCNDVEPVTLMEKSLYTVDELTGIIQAAARIAEMVGELELKPGQMGLIVNRAPNGVLDAGILAEIEKQGLKLFGVLPHDEAVYRCDCDGEPSAYLPDSDPMKAALKGIMKSIGL